MSGHQSFSAWLDNQLQKTGLSGKDLASKLGVSEATISRVKNGRIPLSPKLKMRMSQTFDLAPRDIPDTNPVRTHQKSAVCIMQHTAPDHTTINYALKQGLFQNRGIHATEVINEDRTDWAACIKEQLDMDHTVIAVGTESEFRAEGLTPSNRIFSHIYRGFSLITRSTTSLPSVEGAAVHQRIFVLKMLLEKMENSRIWADNCQRFSWATPLDLKFLTAIRTLSQECNGLVCHDLKAPENQEHPTDPTHTKAGLDSLHEVGKQGADIVIGDLNTLAEAYADPQTYKTLLSLDTLTKIISNLDANAPATLQEALKRAYGTNKSGEAIERFKATWRNRLDEFETPIYWHVFCPETKSASSISSLSERIAAVLQDLQQEFATPHLRESTISKIYRHCNGGVRAINPKIDCERFQIAWNTSLIGI